MFFTRSMHDDGRWHDYFDPDGKLAGSSITVRPVFSGGVHYEYSGNCWLWRITINGERLAGYPTIARAKDAVDWEIRNRVRVMWPAYRRVVARHHLSKIGVKV